jgi:hypothetical protein
MTQAEHYVSMCIRMWTSWGDALRSGKCGNAPWKRWAEWEFPNRHCNSFGWLVNQYTFKGVRYLEQTRHRIILVNGKRTKIKERRLVRA